MRYSSPHAPVTSRVYNDFKFSVFFFCSHVCVHFLFAFVVYDIILSVTI